MSKKKKTFLREEEREREIKSGGKKECVDDARPRVDRFHANRWTGFVTATHKAAIAASAVDRLMLLAAAAASAAASSRQQLITHARRLATRLSDALVERIKFPFPLLISISIFFVSYFLSLSSVALFFCHPQVTDALAARI